MVAAVTRVSLASRGRLGFDTRGARTNVGFST